MIAAILLIVMMAVAIVATELIMRCSEKSKESVDSPIEITGD
ncbi:hypothetical protein ACFLIM_11840 [Nonomuraea sp. M3C6]|uniref:Uncharacterized protein n=1 Tax=Nonomuraea marmarensis TaxID=3351344 RepID=A0ABW7AA29_9ACTN